MYYLLTPLTLATIFISSIWEEEKTLNSAHARFKGCFPILDLEQLVNISKVLKSKLNIEAEINNNDGQGFGRLLINNSSKAVFTEVVKKHILPSQHQFLMRKNLILTFGTLYTKRGFVSMSLPTRCLAFSQPGNNLNLPKSKQINLPEVDLEFLEWFRGFCDAEGTFNFRATSSSLKKLVFSNKDASPSLPKRVEAGGGSNHLRLGKLGAG